MDVVILNGRETLIAAILVLFLGKWLTLKIDYLRKNNLPEPVTGGVLAALLSLILFGVFGVEIEFTMTNRDMLLVVFFTTIGLSAQFRTLVAGGKALGLMLASVSTQSSDRVDSCWGAEHTPSPLS